MTLFSPTLNTPILTVIRSEDYQDFMSGKVASCMPIAALKQANARAGGLFGIQETIRSAWNEIVLWRPNFCGKKHEQPNPTSIPGRCPRQNNPCCGHADVSKLFHTFGTCGQLAQHRDAGLKHPGEILRASIDVDYTAAYMYGTESDEEGYSTPPPELIATLEVDIKKEEERVYHEITRPWMMRVSEILKAA